MSKLNSFKAGPIVLDVIGKTLSKEDIRRIAHPKTGGVILFGRNYQDRAQLTALTKAIKAIRSDVMISIDHEGGRVQRCRTDGFTHLPAMKSFVLPGGHLAVSTTHVARCVCRRAERCCVNMQEQSIFVDPLVIKYLNRLSDYLFVLSRYIGHILQVAEIPWKPRL